MYALKWADISDVHLGHPNTPTQHILNNIDAAFPPDLETESLDIFFISGDMFDRLLSFPDDSVDDVEYWIAKFLRMCKRFNIVVRVLEGTPSHDWKQSKVFEKINRNGEIGCDVKHVTTLSIEHLEQFHKTVLYVPDEWLPEPDDTWKEVKNLLSINGLEQVDFAIMHGSFPHQLPSHLKLPMHDPVRYLSIVKYVIAIGHIHRHTTHERIIAPGSFDRLSHGEEEAKGHIRFYLKNDDTWEVKFIENVGAKIYKTISCLGLSVEEALERVSAVARTVPKHSYLRIEADKEDAIVVSLDVLKAKFPNIVWSTKIATKDSKGREMLVDMRAKYKGIDITKDNLFGLLMERVTNKALITVDTKYCGELLQEVINQ